jgi:hypothetical protein
MSLKFLNIYKLNMIQLVFIHKLIMAMSCSAALKVGVIQCDILLDEFEEIIRRERCICCRAREYWEIDPVKSHSVDVASTVPTFLEVMAAYNNLLTIAQQVEAASPSGTSRFHQHHHGHDKMFIRDLVDMERKVVAMLHFHPLLNDMHQCYLNYDDAVSYGVELVSTRDDVFATHQTMKYIHHLDQVRDLFK